MLGVIRLVFCCSWDMFHQSHSAKYVYSFCIVVYCCKPVVTIIFLITFTQLRSIKHHWHVINSAINSTNNNQQKARYPVEHNCRRSEVWVSSLSLMSAYYTHGRVCALYRGNGLVQCQRAETCGHTWASKSQHYNYPDFLDPTRADINSKGFHKTWVYFTGFMR